VVHNNVPVWRQRSQAANKRKKGPPEEAEGHHLLHGWLGQQRHVSPVLPRSSMVNRGGTKGKVRRVNGWFWGGRMTERKVGQKECRGGRSATSKLWGL